MQVQKYQYTSTIGTHEIVVETGTYAQLAGGSVTVSYTHLTLPTSDLV